MRGLRSTMLRATQEWLEYHLETAEHMLRTGRHLYAILFCHLALEKTLKAAVVEVTQEVPPRTHSFIALGYTPEEVERVEPATFLQEILRTGVVAWEEEPQTVVST